MRRFLMIAAALIPLMGAVGIDHADARLGGGHSLGSRGSFTYRPPRPTSIAPGAAPFERSQAPAAGYGNRAYGTPGGNFAQRRPFLTGLMGGFIGAGIFGLLFGNGFMHMGLGFGGLFGVLIQLIILFFLVRWLFRLFTGRRSGQPSIYGPTAGTMGRQYGGIGPGQEAMGPSVQPLQLTPADRQAFAQCLTYVQQAWGAADLRAISQAATPELMNYFQDQLNTLNRQGLRNRVADVQVENMELSEAWSEGDTDYATVAMRFSMIDITEDRSGRIVDGDPNVRALVSEIWTFTRRRGSHWILAAIQQTN
jgi:predicted lipid-binding transport protein (Tim44 family)